MATPPDAGESRPVLSNPAVVRTFLVGGAGFMFAGMAVWVLVLDPHPEAAPWAGWRIRDAALTLTAAFAMRGLAQAVWATVLLGREERGGAPVPELTRNLGDGAWQTLAWMVAVGAFALGPYRLDTDALGLVPASPRWLAIGAAIGFVAGPGAILGFVLLCRWLGHRPHIQTRQLEFLAPDGPGQVRPWAAIAGMVLVAAVFGPVVEELLFRGVVYPGLRNELGPWAAVPLSAALFGLGHWKHGRDAVLVTGVLGVVFALLVEFGGSVWPAIVAHVLINTKVIAGFVPWFRGTPAAAGPISPEPQADGLGARGGRIPRCASGYDPPGRARPGRRSNRAGDSLWRRSSPPILRSPRRICRPPLRALGSGANSRPPSVEGVGRPRRLAHLQGGDGQQAGRGVHACRPGRDRHERPVRPVHRLRGGQVRDDGVVRDDGPGGRRVHSDGHRPGRAQPPGPDVHGHRPVHEHRGPAGRPAAGLHVPAVGQRHPHVHGDPEPGRGPDADRGGHAQADGQEGGEPDRGRGRGDRLPGDRADGRPGERGLRVHGDRGGWVQEPGDGGTGGRCSSRPRTGRRSCPARTRSRPWTRAGGCSRSSSRRPARASS